VKVSIDGLRRSLATSYNEAVAAFKYDNRDRLQDALWDLRSMIGAMMCVYSADPDDFFSNMTDEAEKLAEPTDPESRP